jgi:two-component system chemotaxis response regulator CheY
MAGITHILIVEDNDMTAQLYQKLLGNAGYEVLTAADGASAMQVLSGIEVELIVLDYILPDQTGVEWLASLRQHPHYAKTPVILTSAVQQQESLRHDPYVWFMEKPAQPQHIVTAVKHTIEQFGGN